MDLEKSIASPPANAADAQAVDLAIKLYQKQILGKLKAIRDALVAEGGDVATIRRERDEARAENAALKKDVERLNYRVRHLVKALNEEEQKNQK